MEPLLQVLTVLFLVALNGFFVAAEFAFVKMRAAQLSLLAEKGGRRVKTAQHILMHLDEYLSACQIGITLASLALGWVGEPFIARYLRPLLETIGIHSEAIIHTIAFTVAFSIITFLHITIGEMAPKSVAIRRPVAVGLALSLPLRLFFILSYPFTYVLNSSAIFFVRMVGVDTKAVHGHAHSEEEIRLLLEDSGRAGKLSIDETEMIERVFEFHDREAHQIIVPRPDIVYLLAEGDAEENLKVAESCGFTRFPLCRENIDHVLGFVHVKDVYKAVRLNGGPVDLQTLRREILFFPEHTPLGPILREFQRKKVHVGIVLDEYGGTLGMITLEDVIEELVGEIQDEFDSELPVVRRVGQNEFLLDGNCPLADFEGATGIEVREAEADTVAGVILEAAGHLPEAGERIPIDGGVLVVERVEERRIRLVRLIRAPREEKAIEA